MPPFPQVSPCHAHYANAVPVLQVTPAWRLNPKPDFKHFCQEKVVVTDPTSVKFTFH